MDEMKNKETEVKRSRAWYLVALMSLSYGIGELSHFMVGTTSRAMAQDLHYGDQSCLKNDSLWNGLETNVTCSDFEYQESYDIT